MPGRRDYPEEAVERAKQSVLRMVKGSPVGTVAAKSWEQLDKDEIAYKKRAGDNYMAPLIAGCDALEREGKLERLGPRPIVGDEWIVFRAL